MRTFISHSQKDKSIYSLLCKALDGAGVPRWDPKSMSPSDSLAEQLRNAIEDCSSCIFVATNSSIKSNWCHAELGAFWGAGKRIYLYMGEPSIKSTKLPPHFIGGLWTDDVDRLIESIEKESTVNQPHVIERVGNVFWLAHDLARAVRLAKFEIGNIRELDKNLRQSLYHLSEINLEVKDARNLLLRSLAIVRNSDNLTEEEGNKLAVQIAKAKNEIGEIISGLQSHFNAWATIDYLDNLEDEVTNSKF